MIVVDSSVAIAAFASWHGQHDDARAIVRSGPDLIAHAQLEAYSVLTRLPDPHRVSPLAAATYLEAQFPRPPLILDQRRQQTLVGDMSRAGIAGGAVYDALIAFTAAAHDATLVSLDARAAVTYQRCGARFELLL